MLAELTWVSPDHKIHAIQDIRASTGVSLKQAKDAYEAVNSSLGHRYQLFITNIEAWEDSEYIGGTLSPGVVPSTNVDNVIDAFLGALPGSTTVAEVRAVRVASRTAKGAA